MKEGIGIAPGKCILLGEHAVVYGHPAIATAIDVFSKVRIKKNPEKSINLLLRDLSLKISGNTLNDLFQKINQSNSYQIIFLLKGLEYWQKKYNITLSELTISIESDLWQGAGLGSSASVSVALFKALQNYFNISFVVEECLDFSYEMEKVSHGNPSGIDNATCSYENTIFFQNQEITKLEPKFVVPLLIIYSGEPHNTKQSVLQINTLKSNDPDHINDIFEKIGIIAYEGKQTLEQGNIEVFQDLIEENQKFLGELGLMTAKMEAILKLGEDLNIRGMKLTGAGNGGCMIALDEPKKLEKFQMKLNKLNYQTKMVQMNFKSPSIDINKNNSEESVI